MQTSLSASIRLRSTLAPFAGTFNTVDIFMVYFMFYFASQSFCSLHVSNVHQYYSSQSTNVAISLLVLTGSGVLSLTESLDFSDACL